MKPIRMAALLALATLTASALAVHPQSWTHQVESDYKPGTFDNTVVDSYGELTLGREIKPVTIPADADFVNGFAQTKDGTVYFGTSPGGKVYKIAGGKAEMFYTPPEEHDAILALATDAEGNLLAAESGDTARLVRLTESKGQVTAKTLFEEEGVTSIWTVKPGPDGALYLGTGPKGKVYRLAGEKASVALETGGKNVLAVAFDGKGNLLAGTDGNGLVVRQDKETKKAFVLLDAGSADVTSIVTDEAGNVYVATAASEGGSGPEDEEEPGVKSRPGKIEVEPTEPPEENMPDTRPAPKPAETKPAAKPAKPETKPAKKGGSVGMVTVPPLGISAEMPPMSPELKTLLLKAEAVDKKPPTNKKLPLATTTSKGKKGMGKGAPRRPSEDEPEEGSAVYRIAPDGTVRTVLKESSSNLALLLRPGELIVGTGTEGKIYSYKPEGESQALIARVTNENVMALFAAVDGTVYVGTSNSGAAYAMSANVAPTGTFVSEVLDAGHTATWGRGRLLANVPEGSKATLAVRSGNVKDVKKFERFWSDWSAEIPAEKLTDQAAAKIANPASRYMQYRITLSGDGKTEAKSPAVQQVRIAYQVENLPPRLKDLRAEVSSLAGDDAPRSKTPEDGPDRSVFISWEASDPNRDELTFRVLYREAESETWVQIAKDVTETSYSWNTRSVPDGRYQIKVIASDANDNTPETARSVAQVTGPFVIDNSPPALVDLAAEADGNRIKVTGTAKDKLSPVTDVRYQVDGEQDWHLAVALDKIFDSPSEGFTVLTRALSPGNHRITIRATDSHGNSCSQAVTATVK